jgi:hypothetical protein
MHMRRILLASALLLSFAVGAPAHATKQCYAYSITAPVVGTNTGSGCPVSNPATFTVGHTIWNCTDVPPIGTTECVTLVIWTPI